MTPTSFASACASRVAVLGSGAAAVGVCARLARSSNAEIHVFDRYPLGSSLAFDNTDLHGTCNTSDGSNLGYFQGLPSQPGQAPRSDDGHFSPRHHLGAALHASANSLRSLLGVRLVDVDLSATRLTLSESSTGSTWSVQAGTWTFPGYDQVYLCRGLSRPLIPSLYSELVGRPTVASSPYPLRRIRTLFAGRRVVIIGTNLSAVETALMLAATGSQVVMASRSATVPSVRTHLSDRDDLLTLAQHAVASYHPQQGGFAAYLSRHSSQWGYGFPDASPVGQQGDAVADDLQASLDSCATPSHWSHLVAPWCRAMNTRPELTEVFRRDLEHPRLRRYINAINAPTARALIPHLREGSIRIVHSGPVQPQGSGYLMHSPDGEISAEAVVLACGWDWPEQLPTIGRSSDATSTLAPAVIAVGAEAHPHLAVPNALFSLEDHLRRLFPTAVEQTPAWPAQARAYSTYCSAA